MLREQPIPHQAIPKFCQSAWMAMGSLLFLIGSTQYASNCSHDYCAQVGGWSFTIGSIFFLMVDSFELWALIIVPSCWEVTEETALLEDLESREFYSRLKKGFFAPVISVFSTTLFVIGAAMFIPAVGMQVMGTKVFIVGLFAVMVAQTFKLLRIGIRRGKYSILNYESCLLWTSEETLVLFGATYFNIGCIIFLPRFDITDLRTDEAAGCFIIGSGLYILGSFFKTWNTTYGINIYFHFPNLEHLGEVKKLNAANSDRGAYNPILDTAESNRPVSSSSAHDRG